MNKYEDKYWDLITKYVSNNITLEETDILLKWIEADPTRTHLLEDLQRTWNQTVNLRDPEFHTDAAWEKMQQKLKFTPEHKAKVNWKILQVAASLVFIFVAAWLAFSVLNSPSDILVKTASQTKEIVLPDGSKVYLNQNSRLVYNPELNNGSERKVELEGEAFFEVSKNPKKPFIITSRGTNTKVLGTSFNVRAYDGEDDVKVSVVTGKVQFSNANNGKQKLLLTPGFVGSFNKSKALLSKESYDNPNFLFWKNKKLVFNNAMLSDVLATVGNDYHATFKISNSELKAERVTVSFDHNSLDQVNRIFETLLDVKIDRVGSEFIVSKK